MSLKSIPLQTAVLFITFLYCTQLNLCKGAPISGCKLSERNALLDLKQGLKDNANRLSSWISEEDCCTWEGIACNNITGHVIRLDLRNPHPITGSDYPPYNRWSLGGKIGTSLLNLKLLQYLDLSMNYFGGIPFYYFDQGIPIPGFIGSLHSLTYLNLSQTGFGGLIPHQLGNLSRLQYLDLSYGDYLVVDDALWISGLSSLRHLNMDSVSFQNEGNWVDALNMLPSIIEIHLSECNLGGISLSLPHINFTNLSILDLSRNYFNLKIPLWLFNIKSLTYIDLTESSFMGSIPAAVGNLTNLHVLDLGTNQLEGSFPAAVGNLTNLHVLDLGTNQLEGSIPAAVGNLTNLHVLDLGTNLLEGSIPAAVRNLTNLHVLDLGDNRLEGSIPAAVGNLANLHVLDLGDNRLEGSIPAAVGNLANLHVLDLGVNQLEGWLPKELGSLCNLQTLNLFHNNFSSGRTELAEIFSGCIKYRIENLDLGWTSLTSSLPEELGNLQMLRTLNMYDNSLYGVVPESLGGLLALEELDLSYNNLNGTIPASLGQLSKLVQLDLSANLFEGVISEAHFTNLTGLKGLDLSSNKLVLKVSLDWVPPFRLDSIGMGSCMLGPQFPTWLKTQRNVSYLDISNNGILGPLPHWFWNLFSCSSDAFYSCSLDISHNGITGRLPDLSDLPSQWFILNSNYLEGPFPNLSSTVLYLDLSNNSFSGLFPSTIWKSMPSLEQVYVSRNQFIGDIPPSLCLLQNLEFLDLSRNFFSGDLPNCWGQSYLAHLDFSSNNLSGSVPHIHCPIPNFVSLHLSNNRLSGEIPPSLQRCTTLLTLDLGQNKLTGRIPTWIGESLVNLWILSLRSNMFSGKIPPNLSRLSALQILDVGNNYLSGEIPRSFGNFTTMRITLPYDARYFGYIEYFQAKIKGGVLEYDDLSEISLMDLSENKLSGEIPGELVSLAGLVSLNLSGNHLTGEIPQNICLLHSLESLDLSRNEFTGAIPSSMTSLTFLADLNLSYNNLLGSIPSGKQFNTFSNQSYIGNPGLCGFPLTKTCHTNGTDQGLVGVNMDEEEAESDMWCFYVSMGPGFVVGFWAVLGTLLLKKNWRIAYFRYIDYIYDRAYVEIAVRWNVV